MIKEKVWGFGGKFQISSASGASIYLVDGKAFSWGDKLSFQDMVGNELAYINQKIMSFKPRYEIHRDGELFAEVIKEFSWFNKEFTLDVPGPNDYSIKGSFWKHEYQFYRSGKMVAEVAKKTWAWTDSYGVEIVDGEDDVAILCAAVVIDLVLHNGSKK